MVLLRAYLDDSGSPTQQGNDTLVIGGYVSDVGGWRYFEELWKAALDRAEVPYFHMKEFGNPNGLYNHLKDGAEKEKEFIGSLVDAILSSIHFTPISAIKLSELAKFNATHGLKLDPYALAIYGCLVKLRREYRGEEIEIVFDRFDKSVSRVVI